MCTRIAYSAIYRDKTTLPQWAQKFTTCELLCWFVQSCLALKIALYAMRMHMLLALWCFSVHYRTMVHYVYRTVCVHGSLPSWEPKSIVLLLLPPKPGEAPNLPKHTTEIGFLFTLVIAPHKYRSFWISLFQAFVKYQALLYHQNSTRSWWTKAKTKPNISPEFWSNI